VSRLPYAHGPAAWGEVGLPLPPLPQTPPEGREEGFSLASLAHTLAPTNPPAQSRDGGWAGGRLLVTPSARK